MPEQSVGFIGVGRMGGRMARRLIDAGYQLTIFDTDEAAMRSLTEAEAHAAGSPEAVASAAEIVLASLPTPPIVEAVALAVAHCSRVRVFVDMSTTGATGSAVRQLLSIAAASEGPDADMTNVVKSVERWAGVIVESK